MMRQTTLSLLAAAALATTAGTANAAIVTVHQYNLGEAGSLVSGRPQDSIGSAHFTGGPGFSAVTTSPSPVSGAYIGAGRAFSADYSSLATNNFGMGLWVRTADVNQGASNELVNFISTDSPGTANSVSIGLINGGWAATISNVAWIGDNPVVAQGGNSQTATANEWTHLAFIRDSGTSTFYINGVAQGGTNGGNVIHGTGAHLSVNSGGSPDFSGDLDELRMFTFDPNTDDPVAFLSVNA